MSLDVAAEAAVVEHQAQLLEMLASGAEPGDILTQLVLRVESMLPGGRCSVLLADAGAARLSHGAAPSLPAAYSAAIDGIAVAPGVGSCGTAAHTRRLVVARDTASDPRWAAFRGLAHEHGLRACWSTPITDPDGTVLGTFAVYHDVVHEPSRDEIALLERFSALAAVAIRHGRMLRERRDAEAARAAAEQRSVAKGQLLSAMSHELRTPMSSIVGFAEMLRTVDLPGRRRQDAVAHLSEAAGHLLELVEHLLDLSKLDAGTVVARRDRIAVAGALADAVASLAPLALEHGVQTRVLAVPDDLEVVADARWLRGVVVNLVANAVKYNHPGGEVVVDAARSGDRVRIRVDDTGEGLPVVGPDRLYAPFDRLGAEASDVPGTGLGLTIARSFAEAMDGRLDLRPRAGGGTSATVLLPGVSPRGRAPDAG